MDNNINSVLSEKKACLQNRLHVLTQKDICIAYSGGVDSALLLVMACEAAEKNGTKVYAITADTVLHPKSDLGIAKQVLRKTSAIHEILKINELTVPEIKNNPVNRCYLCKKELMSRMLEFAMKKQCGYLLEGSNGDDLHVYRPGFQAVQELGVKSPLAELGITKKEVRELAAEYKIPVANRPSSPCLATRLPYGTEINVELLKKIDLAEDRIKELGFVNVRVRVYDESVRIEVDRYSLEKVLEKKEEVITLIKNLGFKYVTLDLEGFRSGSMDE